MKDNAVIAIGDEEYAELERLVTVMRNAEDVQYAAFLALCPTGEEGAFDEHMCKIYRALHEAGMIEGDSDGDAFYFRALTDEGVHYVEHVKEGSEERILGAHLLDGEDGEVRSNSHALTPKKDRNSKELAVQSDVQRDSQASSQNAPSKSLGLIGGLQLTKPGSVIAVAALVGLIAGLIGGVAGAYIFDALFS